MSSLKILSLAMLICTFANVAVSQDFFRSELPTVLNTPWEITYGPDNYLYITEAGGTVSRVEPATGNKTVIYSAPDYFAGSVKEQSTLCTKPKIGAATLGLALHPNFTDASTSYIYFVYSYNHGTDSTPATRFKIKRLLWDATLAKVVADSDIVLNITTGYDHLGGRLLAVKQDNIPYLFLTVGDHGISESNSPDCYVPQSTNPNNLAQDPTTQNGKVHRFTMTGAIPVDNPISGNSFYTRGHRNPQGLMYNTALGLLYDIEHGDRTDDEINVLHKGMNYGWKNVRGYHKDGNFPGEVEYVKNYVPDVRISNDSLVEAFYSFCPTVADTSANNATWCTIAPSDGLYYGGSLISEWTNSLLITTLKDGLTTDMGVYQLRLNQDGTVAPSTTNPKLFFGADQKLNGRLRDIAISNDEKTVYLINNGGADRDKISVYTYTKASEVSPVEIDTALIIYPNPASNELQIEYSSAEPGVLTLTNTLGVDVITMSVSSNLFGSESIKLNNFMLAQGVYTLRLQTGSKVQQKNIVIAR